MATLTSHTLVAGLYSPYYSFRGWNSPQQGLLSTSFGTLDGSVNNVDLSSSWGVSNLYLESIYENFDPGGRDLKVFFDGLSSTTTVWYDIQINGTQFRRVDASSSAGATTYSRQYEWAGISSTIVENNTYTIVFTDDGNTQSPSTIIPLGITSGAIDMNTLRNFFGEPTWGSSMISMSDLFKGGNLVPDIVENTAIPTSGAIDLADFYGADTYLEIEKHPQLNSIFVGFGGSAGTAIVPYNVSTDPNAEASIDVGYKALKSVCEYRWVINVTNQNGLNLNRIVYNGTTYTNPTTPFTTPWAGNPTMRLEVDHGVQTSNIAGTVYFEVRKVWNGTTYSLTSNSAFWEVVVENAGE